MGPLPPLPTRRMPVRCNHRRMTVETPPILLGGGVTPTDQIELFYSTGGPTERAHW